MSMFKKATREKLKGRIALMGPSGSGKSYTALTFAKAFGAKIAVIDTECRSASKYAGDVADFDVLELANHSPKKYIEAINAAGKEGYDVIVVDSLSHAWTGRGGALEMVDNAAKRGGNKFAGWRDVTPLHNQLIDAMLQSPCHVIVTMRTKMEHVMEQDERGRTVVRKVGMKPLQREGMEYEFDLICDITQEHDLIVSKTRCSALDGAVENKPDSKFLGSFVDWLDKGEEPAEIVVTTKEKPLVIGPAADSIMTLLSECADADSLEYVAKKHSEFFRNKAKPAEKKAIWARILEMSEATGVSESQAKAWFAAEIKEVAE